MCCGRAKVGPLHYIFGSRDRADDDPKQGSALRLRALSAAHPVGAGLLSDDRWPFVRKQHED
jgi:hypothetical protein